MGRSLKNAEGTGLPEGLLARLRLFWMVRTGPRLAEIRQQGKGGGPLLIHPWLKISC
jgi:hypothetical protein